MREYQVIKPPRKMLLVIYYVLIFQTIHSVARSGPDTLALFSISNCPDDLRNHCENARINEIRMRLAHSITMFQHISFVQSTLKTHINSSQISFWMSSILKQITTSVNVSIELKTSLFPYRITMVSSLLMYLLNWPDIFHRFCL